jgi:hypothetical protein
LSEAALAKAALAWLLLNCREEDLPVGFTPNGQVVERAQPLRAAAAAPTTDLPAASVGAAAAAAAAASAAAPPPAVKAEIPVGPYGFSMGDFAAALEAASTGGGVAEAAALAAEVTSAGASCPSRQALALSVDLAALSADLAAVSAAEAAALALLFDRLLERASPPSQPWAASGGDREAGLGDAASESLANELTVLESMYPDGLVDETLGTGGAPWGRRLVVALDAKKGLHLDLWLPSSGPRYPTGRPPLVLLRGAALPAQEALAAQALTLFRDSGGCGGGCGGERGEPPAMLLDLVQWVADEAKLLQGQWVVPRPQGAAAAAGPTSGSIFGIWGAAAAAQVADTALAAPLEAPAAAVVSTGDVPAQDRPTAPQAGRGSRVSVTGGVTGGGSVSGGSVSGGSVSGGTGKSGGGPKRSGGFWDVPPPVAAAATSAASPLQRTRESLPAWKARAEVVAALASNQVVLISGGER